MAFFVFRRKLNSRVVGGFIICFGTRVGGGIGAGSTCAVISGSFQWTFCVTDGALIVGAPNAVGTCGSVTVLCSPATLASSATLGSSVVEGVCTCGFAPTLGSAAILVSMTGVNDCAFGTGGALVGRVLGITCECGFIVGGELVSLCLIVVVLS